MDYLYFNFFFLATRNEETSDDSQDEKTQDIWEQQQMRKAVKITKVVIFYTICISFVPYVFVVTNYHKLDGLKQRLFSLSC